MKDMKDLSKKMLLGLTMATGVAAAGESSYNEEITTAIEVLVLAIVGLTYGCIKSMKADNNISHLISNMEMGGQVGIIGSSYLKDDNSEITIVVDENYETKTNISDITCVNEFEKDITEMEI